MSDKVVIEKLNGENYPTWKFKMELYLIKEGLWDVVNKEIPVKPEETWLTKDGKARAAIGLRVADSQLGHIRKQTTAKAAWGALKDYHQKATLSNTVSLIRRLCSIRLHEGGNMEDHIHVMEDTMDQLAALSEAMEDKMAIAFLLSSLPESYATLITALETRPEGDLTLSLVKMKMVEEYKRQSNHASGDSSAEVKALKVQYQKYNMKDSNSGKGGSQDSAAGQKGSCFFCKKSGHFKKDCRKYIEWKKKNSSTADKVKKTTHSESSDDEQPICFKVKDGCNPEKWYVDSGASVHICCRKGFFSTLNSSVNRVVQVAGGKEVVAKGIGEGTLRCKTGVGDKTKTVIVKNVLFVPEFNGSLLSVKQLNNKGLDVNFNSGKCFITANGKAIATATAKRRVI